MPIIRQSRNSIRSLVSKSVIVSLLILLCFPCLGRTKKQKYKKAKVKKHKLIALSGPKSTESFGIKIHDYLFEFDRAIIRNQYKNYDLGLIESMINEVDGQTLREVVKFFAKEPAAYGLPNANFHSRFQYELQNGTVYASHIDHNEEYLAFQLTHVPRSKYAGTYQYRLGVDDQVITTLATSSHRYRRSKRWRRKYRKRRAPCQTCVKF